jgi:hypothetical protein
LKPKILAADSIGTSAMYRQRLVAAPNSPAIASIHGTAPQGLKIGSASGQQHEQVGKAAYDRPFLQRPAAGRTRVLPPSP